MLGLAEVLEALARQQQPPQGPIMGALAALPQQVVAAKLLRGKGGDLMRGAYCRWGPRSHT